MRRISTAISPAAYSGGTVVFHAPNYGNYYAQAQAHRMAKQQALSQYYDRVQTSINPAGVRDVDMAGWQKKTDDWNKFGIENRDALVDPRRDGGRALNQFNAMHRDLLGDIQKSKQAAQKELVLSKIYSDPRKSALATKNDMVLAHGLSSSIYSPDHYKDDGVTPHDLSEFSFNAPPFDLKKQVELNRLVTSGLKKDRTYGKGGAVDPQTRLTIVPYQEKHSNANLKTIAERTGQAFDGDPSMQQYYENQTLDPNTYDQYSKAYKSMYPNDDMGTDARKIAMAENIVRNSQVDTGNVTKSVSRPPIGRGLTKAQQDQQLMLGLTNQMAAAMKSGNIDEVKRLGGVWFSGNGKSQYQDIDAGPTGVGNPKGMNLPENIKNGFIVKHIDKQWVPDDPKNPAVGSYKDVMNQTVLDPNDPQLIPKLANLHQTFMGSTPALEKGVVGQTLNTPPMANPAPTDVDAKLKKYSGQ